MKFWKSAEWQRIGKFRGLKALLVGIAIIPSIYAVIFLSSLWNAYGNLNQLPVAIVNQDKSAQINGQTKHLGRDLTDKLIKKQALKFSEVSSEKAKSGLKSGKYYMTITIPSDFTNNAGTLLSDTPKNSQILIAHNAGQSFIAEKMTSSAATKIQASVNQSLQKVYNETILSATKSSQKGFQSGSNGANKLNNGLGQLSDGSKTLNDGANTLASGTSTLATGLTQYTNGVTQANTGSATLTSGSKSAASGANQLASGTSQLVASAPKLETGSQQLAEGAEQLATQLQAISQNIDQSQTAKATDLKTLDTGLGELTTGLNQLKTTLGSLSVPDITIDPNTINTDSTKLSQGLSDSGTAAAELKSQFATLQGNADLAKLLASNPELAQQFQKISATSDQLTSGLQTSAAAAKSLQTSLGSLTATLPKLQALQAQLVTTLPKLQALSNGTAATDGARQAIATLNSSLTAISQGISQKAVPGAQQLASGATQINSGQQQVTSAATQLNAGAGQLASGNNQLADGASQLSTGLQQLNDKSSQLNSGAGQLNTGSQQLATGTSQIVTSLAQAQSGTKTLAEKLADGAIKLSVIHSGKSNVAALTQPVRSSQSNISTVDNNGTGMTPYMMSVGLFVGMITFSAIYDFVTVAKKPRSGFAWWADKQTVNMPVWIAQAIIITTLLIWVDGLHPKQTVMLYVAALIVAFAFNQFVLLFSTLFGKLGSGLMIIALVLQLSASAGSYPIELSNNFFKAIHPFMPMTYSVHAFREAISIGGSLTADLIVLLSVGIVSMVLTWGVYHWKLRHNQMLWAS